MSEPSATKKSDITIMAVDDNIQNLKLLEGMLKGAGYKVRAALDGATALKAAALAPPHLIFLDINMPEMDGFEVCRRLKADEKLKDIPVIFISAITETAGKLEAFDCGGVDYVTKPFRFREVQARLETHLALRDLQLKLEERVQQRTLELEQVNINLRQEIVDRKNAEEEKRALEKQLIQAEKMESLGTMAGGIAHDFNNLLTPVLGFSELVQLTLDEQDVDNKLRIAEVILAAKRGQEMIKQIMAFSRRGTIDKSVVNITSLVNEAVNQLRATIPTAITIDQHLDQASGMVLADPTQIHQIIMNLGINSYHAMEEKQGTLTISVTPVIIETRQSQSCYLEPGSYISIKAQDTGKGIEKRYLDRIFDPFFTTKKQGKGTGLGLTMVHSIVSDHDGCIKVASELGQGTIFSIFLPKVAESTKHIVNEPEDTAPLKQGHGHILVVDDDEQVAHILTEILKVAGYTVTSSTDSHLVPDLFKKNMQQFDLLITDMRMPTMDGKELSHTLLGLRPDLPIIMCSGYTNKKDHTGPWTFLAKPVIPRDLIAAVQLALNQ